MIKIKAKDLINSNELVREPVDKEVNDILNMKDKRIILTGNRGTGRSTVLYGLKNKGLDSKEKTIYHFPASIIILSKEPNERFSDKVFDCFYELCFTYRILEFIKINYPMIFEKYFKKDNELVENLINKYYIAINNSLYEEVSFDTNITTKELSLDTLKRFREIMEIEKLNIAIDRFDSVNGSSQYVQQIYKKYFDMFDKVILVSDDKNLDKQELLNKGYNLRKITYGNDKDVLREIVRRRILLNNKEKNEKISEEIFTSDLVLDKVVQLGNNIDFSLGVLSCINHFFSIYNEHSVEEIIDKSIEDRKEYAKKIERISPKRTLYL